jgi:hypothetical protein
VKKGGWFDTPDGIITHLTKKRHVLDVTCGSFQKEAIGANPHSEA